MKRKILERCSSKSNETTEYPILEQCSSEYDERRKRLWEEMDESVEKWEKREKEALEKFKKEHLKEKEESESIQEFEERERQVEIQYLHLRLERDREQDLIRLKRKEEKAKIQNEYYEKIRKPLRENTGRYLKKFSEMTDDEIISLCYPFDRKRAKRVVNNLRTYLTKAKESEGFDIDPYPGWFAGLTSAYPIEYEPGVPRYFDFDKPSMGRYAIDEYNRENEENKKFEFVDVVKINLKRNDWHFYCYMTIRGCEVTTTPADDDNLKTFQAIVQVGRYPPKRSIIYGVHFCRLV